MTAATDTAGNSSSKDLTITINDLDEIAPTITSDGTVAVDENTSTNTVIYTITANENCTFSISGVDKNEFNDACACSAACSTGAMSFGDINNKESEVYKRKKDERVYHLLEYVGTKPNVFYHTKVRNIDKSI